MRNLCYNNRAFGGVAQLGERTVRIRKVKGSNPSVSTIKSADDSQRVFLFVNVPQSEIFNRKNPCDSDSL